MKNHFQGIDFWIGLKETDSKNSLNWVDGSDFSFGNTLQGDPWQSGEPNNV